DENLEGLLRNRGVGGQQTDGVKSLGKRDETGMGEEAIGGFVSDEAAIGSWKPYGSSGVRTQREIAGAGGDGDCRATRRTPGQVGSAEGIDAVSEPLVVAGGTQREFRHMVGPDDRSS